MPARLRIDRADRNACAAHRAIASTLDVTATGMRAVADGLHISDSGPGVPATDLGRIRRRLVHPRRRDVCPAGRVHPVSTIAEVQAPESAGNQARLRGHHSGKSGLVPDGRVLVLRQVRFAGNLNSHGFQYFQVWCLPQRGATNQPGATPQGPIGRDLGSPERATQHALERLVSPFQGSALVGCPYLGRCPRLIY